MQMLVNQTDLEPVIDACSQDEGNSGGAKLETTGDSSIEESNVQAFFERTVVAAMRLHLGVLDFSLSNSFGTPEAARNAHRS